MTKDSIEFKKASVRTVYDIEFVEDMPKYFGVLVLSKGEYSSGYEFYSYGLIAALADEFDREGLTFIED